MNLWESDCQYALVMLEKLGSAPAAPYFEEQVLALISQECDDLGLKLTHDPFGNIIVERPGLDKAATGMAFVAHLDHPGFEVISRKHNVLIARTLGGVPKKSLDAGVGVSVICADGSRVSGVVTGPHGDPGAREVTIEIDTDPVGELPLPVVFDLPDYVLDEKTIYMRALDDLAGCAAALTVMRSAVESNSPGAVFGLFTRAEELGLIGARLIADQRLIPKDTIIISIESSRSLPGAEIGRGPVIRVGDAQRTFDQSAEAYLISARDRLIDRSCGGFYAQRQLMSGGTCEASAFGAYGYPVTGLAFPLGNYHNEAPDGDIACEYIDKKDFEFGVALLLETATLAGTLATVAKIDRLVTLPVPEANRLKARALDEHAGRR